MNEKKIRSFRFDKLNGGTPLRRMLVLLRHRNIRNLVLFVMSILVFCVEILFLFYISRLYGETSDSFLIALIPLLIMTIIDLPVLLWLIFLVFRPDKTYVMRRLGRLGDPERLAGELEEDLAAADGVLFQKGSLCVTKRFIIEANLFCYRVYPLEGLCEFDCQKILFLPAFRYKNGIIIKMVSRVPFRMLRPYIGPEVKVNMGIEKPEAAVVTGTQKPKHRKRNIVGLVVFILVSGTFFNLSVSVWGIRAMALCCCSAVMLVLAAVAILEMFNSEEDKNKRKDTFAGLVIFFCPAAISFYFLYFNKPYKLPSGLTYAAALYGFGVLVWLSSIAVSCVMKDRGLKRTLAEIKDPGDRIRKMEELCAAGFYKNRVLYLNQLSALYYDNQDFKKALELIREAVSSQSGKRDSQTEFGITISEMLRLNEITYLIALERFSEAEPLLTPFCEKRYKNSVATYLINTARAQLAIKKDDAKAAREYLRRMFGLSYKALTEERHVNISCHLLLLEAECDLLEKDTVSMLAKLDDILARSTWPATVKRAAELKETARRKKTGSKRRKHGSPARQARRRSGTAGR